MDLSNGVVSVRLKRGGGPIFAVAAALLTFFIVDEMRNRVVPVWVDVGHSLEASLLFLGPLTAAATAYRAERERQGPLWELVSTTSRRSYVRDAALLAGEVGWSTAVYLAIAGWLIVITALRARTGFPDLELITAGLSALLACAALGFFLGRAIAVSPIPAVVAVVVYLAIWLGGTGGGPFKLLSPLIDGEPTPLLPFPVEVGLLQTLWFLGLSVVLFGCGVLWDQWSRSVLTATLCATLICLGAAIGLVTGPTVFASSVGAEYAAACTRGVTPILCVHPAYSSVLQDAAGVAADTLNPIEDATGWPSRVLEVGTRADIHVAEDLHPGVLATTTSPVGNQGFDSFGFAQGIAFAVAGFERCADLNPNDSVRLGLAVWLTDRVQADIIPIEDYEFAAWFETQSANGRASWLRNHLAELRGCGKIPFEVA